MKLLKYILTLVAVLTLAACGLQETTYVDDYYDDEKRFVKIKHDKSEVKEIDFVYVTEDTVYSEEFDDFVYDLNLDFRNGKLSKQDIEKLENEFRYLFQESENIPNLVDFDVKVRQKDDMVEIIVNLTEKIINGESEILYMPEGSTFRDYDEELTQYDDYRRE